MRLPQFHAQCFLFCSRHDGDHLACDGHDRLLHPLPCFGTDQEVLDFVVLQILAVRGFDGLRGIALVAHHVDFDIVFAVRFSFVEP